ncbi:MAG: hypothetical protein LBB67_07375 [Oscillospiraceae bacterium]|jgi:endonuclease III-like uncharacterized protein|nr:hypothetical protein [Oscillospiraceae bacterium]
MIDRIYQTLQARYGDLHWWPAKTGCEVIVGAAMCARQISPSSVAAKT